MTCSVKLWCLGFLITLAAPARGTGVCGACVPLARCPPVARILEGYPYSTHSYFYAAVSCGTVLAPLVCCDADVVRRALEAETEAARAHVDVYRGFPGSAYGGSGEGGAEASGPEPFSHRLKQDASGAEGVEGDTASVAACGSNTKFRIIGGEEAPTGVFPWMARLGYRVRGAVNASPVNYRCGGALVTARYVLTAAHCVVRLPPTTYLALVTLGTDGTPTQSYTPERVVPHAAYNTPRLQNDIALVRLARPAVFTDTVMPICLPFGELAVDLEQLPPRAMLVAGWGSTSANSTAVSTTLQYTRLTYEPLAQCAQLYSDRYNVTIGPDQICTVGDSGGPVFVWEGEGGGARAVGLVSFGARRCGTQGVPTVYTRIDAYQRWIEDNLAM